MLSGYSRREPSSFMADLALKEEGFGELAELCLMRLTMFKSSESIFGDTLSSRQFFDLVRNEARICAVCKDNLV